MAEEIKNIPKLADSKTFPVWNFHLWIVVGAKNLRGIVDGTESYDPNSNSSRRKKWQSRDDQAEQIIVSSIEQELVSHILTCTTAKEMYDKLKEVYQRDTEQQKCQLLQEFFNLQIDKTKNVVTNVSRLRNIAFRLTSLEQPVNETMIITKILTVLPERFQYFNSAWESTRAEDKTLENLCAR